MDDLTVVAIVALVAIVGIVAISHGEKNVFKGLVEIIKALLPYSGTNGKKAPATRGHLKPK